MVRIKTDQSLAVLCLLQLRLQPVPAQQDGGHQEEDAGHEGRRDIQSQLIQPSPGGEGQCLRQGGCLRGAVQGRQGEDLFHIFTLDHNY